MKSIFLTIVFLGLCLARVDAQMSGADVFLQSNWVEVGQAANGSFGAAIPPSLGTYHPSPGPNLGIVYDWGHDGWAVGTPPEYGDYTYPGTPFEGWSIEVNGARSDAYYTTAPTAGASFWDANPGVSSLSGGNVSYSSSSGCTSAVWQGTTTGTSGGLSITQTTQLCNGAPWIIITTVFKNTSSSVLTGLYYERSCDPDNDEPLPGGAFATDNYITYQNDPQHRVLVGASGTVYTNAYLALATKDCRAEALIYASWPPHATAGLTLHDTYNQIVPPTYSTYYYAAGTSVLNKDFAIGLIYYLGDLNPGQSTTIQYAYILSTYSDIDVIFPSFSAGSITGPSTLCVGDNATYSNPTAYPAGTWTSSDNTIANIDPLTAIVAPAGPNSGPVTITYKALSTCDTDSVSYNVIVNPSPVIATVNASPAFVCAGSSSTLTATATYSGTGSPVYTWSPGISATSSVVTVNPSTTTTYTVVAAAGGCSSLPSTVTVSVSPISISPPPVICVGSTATLTGTPTGGTWTCTPSSVATIGVTSGTVTGVSAGVAYITYSLGACSATATVTVAAVPTPSVLYTTGALLPYADMCLGNSFGAAATPGNGGGATVNWTSTPAGIVTIGPVTTTSTSSTAIITGSSVGTTVVTYSVTQSGCTGTITIPVTVNPNPTVSITSSPAAVPGSPQQVLECSGATLTATASMPSSYTWQPPAGLSSTTGTTVTATPSAPTIYTVTVIDNAGHCAATDEINVIPVKNPCICTWIGAGIPFGMLPSAISTSSVASGNYFGGNTTINGAVVLTNCVILMDAGTTITVAPGASLTLDHCHLLSCNPDMWNGINLQPNGTIKLINNTLIEDAQTAITAANPVTPTSSPLIINSSGAIFNKNVTGVSISGYHDPTPPTTAGGPLAYPIAQVPSYPFVFENTVFTSRDFSSYSTTAPAPNYWPFYWPGTTGTDGLKQPWAPPTQFDPPYNIDNPSAYSSGSYPASHCNNGNPADKGIDAEDVGYTGGSGPLYTYSGLVVGTIPSAGNELNMFDGLQYGIYTLNSNLFVRNSVFMHINPDAGGAAGNGIYAEHTTDPTHLYNNYKLYIYGSAGGSGYVATSSSFYDCVTDVETHEYYHVKAEYANLYSGHNAGFLADPKGHYGFLMQSFRYYDVQLNHNNVYNITNGIDYTANPPVGGATQYTGELSIENNNLWINTTGTPPAAGEYITQAIAARASLVSSVETIGEVNIDNNSLSNVFNGISVRGFNGTTQFQTVTTNNNTITVFPDMVTGLASVTPQKGISHISDAHDFIENNTVSGMAFNVPTPPNSAGFPYNVAVLPAGFGIVEAIHCANLSGPPNTVGCNTVHDIGTGFYFEGMNNVYWINNTMTKNAYGFVLNGIIGDQVMTGSGPVACNNQWLPVSFWHPHYPDQTYTMGSTNPAVSRLFVAHGTSTDPIVSDDFESSAIAYDPATTIVDLGPTPPTMSCGVPPASSILYRQSGHESNGVVAYDGQTYTLYPNPNDGNATIEQLIPDLAPVHAQAWNAIGQSVYKSELHFDDGRAALKLADNVPGLYLLQLEDSRGRIYTLKFTIR